MIYPVQRNAEWRIEPGDIFACWGTDRVSRFISWQTSWHSWPTAPRGLRLSPSHVAIACPRYAPCNTVQYWVESCSAVGRECLERGATVSGCQVHHVRDRIADYCDAGGSVSLYRLTPINQFTGHEESQLRDDLIGCFVRQQVGYDGRSAVFSGTRLVKSVEKVLHFWPSSGEAVFCSQLLAAILQARCRMNKDNPAHFNPGRLLRTLVYQGTYAYHTQFTSSDDPRLEFI